MLKLVYEAGGLDPSFTKGRGLATGIAGGKLRGISQFVDSDGASWVAFLGLFYDTYYVVIWDGDLGAPNVPVPRWQPYTSYSIGQFILDSNDHIQEASQPGTSGATEPNWNEAITIDIAGAGDIPTTVTVPSSGTTPDGAVTSIVTHDVKITNYKGQTVWEGDVTNYASAGGVIWQDLGDNPIIGVLPPYKYIELLETFTAAINGFTAGRTGKIYGNFLQMFAGAAAGPIEWRPFGDFAVLDNNTINPVNGPLQPRDFEGHGFYDNWANPVIDELQGLIIDLTGYSITVWSTHTKKILRSTNLPALGISITLANDNLVYVLCSNRLLVLIDYVKSKVLGAVKVPSSPTAEYGLGAVAIGWDSRYKRILVMEQDVQIIKGYQPIPEAVRLTKPVLLDVPRKGSTVRVLVQQVGDLNEGVGESILDVTVTGPGRLVGGITAPDENGRTIFKIECLDVGDINLLCKARVNS